MRSFARVSLRASDLPPRHPEQRGKRPLTNSASEQGVCRACVLEIHPKATVCPHCGSKQSASKLEALSTILRWAGGTTAILSIVIATAQVRDVYSGWSESREAVAELVRAAEVERELGELKRAWSTLESALKIDPASPEVRRAQVDLAELMARRWDTGADDSWDAQIDVLYRGSASNDLERAARALAHVGWLRIRSRGTWRHPAPGEWAAASPLFERALGLDPNCGYASLMRGYARLVDNQSGDTPAGREIVAASVDDFTRARQSGNVPDDELDRIQILGCSRGSSWALAEGLRKAALLAERGAKLPGDSRGHFLNALHSLPYLLEVDQSDSLQQNWQQGRIEKARILTRTLSDEELYGAYFALIEPVGLEDAKKADRLTPSERKQASTEAALCLRLGRVDRATELLELLIEGGPTDDDPDRHARLMLAEIQPPPVGSAPPAESSP